MSRVGAKWYASPWVRMQRIGWTEESSSGCWTWNGDRNARGYGRVRDASRRLLLAHRVAWAAANGRPVPDGMVVRHTCDNPPCVNPEHLLIGSHADNDNDRDSRGRTANGVRIAASALSDDQVDAVRLAVAAGQSQSSVARIYGISQSHVSRLVHRVNRAEPTRKAPA